MKVETQQEGYTNKLNKTNLDKFVRFNSRNGMLRHEDMKSV